MNAPSRWLVTGSSGVLGRGVMRAVEGMDMRQRPAVLRAGRGAGNDVVLDLSGPEIEMPPGVDTVVHLAGEKRDPARMERVNHSGAERLAHAAASAGVRRFVLVSSVGVYGALPHAGVVDEACPHHPRNLYEASKDAGEQAVRRVCDRHGIDLVVLQPTNVIGYEKGASYPLLTLMRMVSKGLFAWFGRAEPWVNYVSVEDTSAAIAAAAHRAPHGTYIINTGAPLRDMVGWISVELGRPAPTAKLPHALGSMLFGAGGVVSRWLGRELPLNGPRFLELTNTTRYGSGLLERTLGFDYPVGIRSQVVGLVRAYREEGLL